MSDSEQLDRLRDELRDQALRTVNLVHRIDGEAHPSTLVDAAVASGDLCTRLVALVRALNLELKGPVASIPGIGRVRFPSEDAMLAALAELAALEESENDA